jgi:hypothetical protein
MHLALPRPSVRWKRHESVMNSVMNSVRGRGSAMSANVRGMKGALMPVRLHRSNSLRIAWDERPDDLRELLSLFLSGVTMVSSLFDGYESYTETRSGESGGASACRLLFGGWPRGAD